MATRALNRLRCVVALLLAVCVAPAPAGAASLPPGFTETPVAGGLSSPTAMQFAPDGRLFVCEQGGNLRVIKNGTLLATPFVSLTVSSSGERGLLGVAFDPNFSANQFVYVYYTATTPNVHNRISRFTANGDVAVPGSEVVLLELNPLSATNHNGGALNFGPDGKLYAAAGENAVGSNAQTLANLLGKVLRINPDGSIPTDNPFYNVASGNNRAIWALGLRNPFTFAFNAAGTRMFINDVGQGIWEEIDDGSAGANYGWPIVEGPNPPSQPYTYPRHAYDHASTGGCAITGGAFYDPSVLQFASFANNYFFADLCGGWIRRLDVATNAVATFATGISQPVDLKVGTDGSLYYLARGIGAVYRVTTTTTADQVTPSSGSGASQTFALRYSDINGFGNLSALWVWFNAVSSSTAANSCLAYYEPSSQLVYLLNDAATAWMSGQRGTGVTLQNSQCLIQLGATTVTGGGTTMTLNLAVSFKATFAGGKSILMFGANANGTGSGWQTRGTWTVAGSITVTSDSVTPSSGSGASQTFALQYSDSAGFSDFATTWVWFNTSLSSSAANSCLVYYERSTFTLFLLNDAATAWTSGTITNAGTLENSQCRIQLAASSVQGPPNTLILNLAMIFKAAFAGPKTIFMYAAGSTGVTSGWQTRGTWTVSGGVAATADSVTPSSGTGASQTFALQYSSTAGFADLATLWVWFNGMSSSTAANSCLAYYERSTNLLYLINDAGTAWSSGPLTSGAGNLENSRCTIQTGASVLSGTGNSLTLNLALIFKPAFSGPKTISMYAASSSGAASGWQTRGSWTVSGGVSVTADSASPNAGSGSSQAFSFAYSDSAGYNDIATAWVWFNASFASTAANSCLIYYDRPTLTLFLLNDTATAWLGTTVPNVGVLENSQCRIQLAASSVQGPPTGVILNLSLVLKPAFAGPKTIFMYVAGSSTSSGWQTRGSWTVP